MKSDDFPEREYPTRQRLGQGMSGTTWIVPNPDSPSGTLVLKEPKEADGLAEADIKREARALAALRAVGCHGVPLLCDVGRNGIGDVRFIVTENLSDHFAPLDSPRPRPFTARDVLRIAKAALTTLERAHSQGFTHSDLEDKPGHVWLRTTNWGADTSEPLVKVMDWGNAQWVAEGGTSSPAEDLAAFASLLLAHWPVGAGGSKPDAEVQARKLLGEAAARAHSDTRALLELVTRLLEEHERDLSNIARNLAQDITASSFDTDLARLRQADPDRTDIAALDSARDTSDYLLEGWLAVVRGFDGLVVGAPGTTTDFDEAIGRARNSPAIRTVYERGEPSPVIPFAEIDRQARRRAVNDSPSSILAGAPTKGGLGEAIPFLEAAHALATHHGVPPLPDRASPAGQAIWREVATILAGQDSARVPEAIALLLLGPAPTDLDGLAASSDISVPPPPERFALPDAFASLVRAAGLADIGHTIDQELQHLDGAINQLEAARAQGTLDPASRELELVTAARDALKDAKYALESVQDDVGTDDPLATVADRLGDRYDTTIRTLEDYGRQRNLVGDLQRSQRLVVRVRDHATALRAAWDGGNIVAVAHEARALASLDPGTARDLAIATNRAIVAARARISVRKASSGTSIAEEDARALAVSLRAIGPAAWLEPALDALEAVVRDGAPLSSVDGSPEARQAREWAAIAGIRALEATIAGRQPPRAVSPTAARKSIDGALAHLRRALDHRLDGPSVARVTAAEASATPGAAELLAVALAIDVDRFVVRALASKPDQVGDTAAAVRAARDEATDLRPTLAQAADLATRVVSRASALDRYLAAATALRGKWVRDGVGIDPKDAESSLTAVEEAITSINADALLRGGDDVSDAIRRARRAVDEARDSVLALTGFIGRLKGGIRADPPVPTRAAAVGQLEQLAHGAAASLDAWLGTDVATHLRAAIAPLNAGDLPTTPSGRAPAIPEPIAQMILALPSERDHAGEGEAGPLTWLAIAWVLPVVVLLAIVLANASTDSVLGVNDARTIGSFQATVLPLLLATLVLISTLSGVVAWLSRSLLAPTARALGASVATGAVGGGLLFAILWPIGIGPELVPLECPKGSAATATFVVTVRGTAQDALRQATTASATTGGATAQGQSQPPARPTASGTDTCAFVWVPDNKLQYVRIGQPLDVSSSSRASDKTKQTDNVSSKKEILPQDQNPPESTPPESTPPESTAPAPAAPAPAAPTPAAPTPAAPTPAAPTPAAPAPAAPTPAAPTPAVPTPAAPTPRSTSRT